MTYENKIKKNSFYLNVRYLNEKSDRPSSVRVNPKKTLKP